MVGRPHHQTCCYTTPWNEEHKPRVWPAVRAIPWQPGRRPSYLPGQAITSSEAGHTTVLVRTVRPRGRPSYPLRTSAVTSGRPRLSEVHGGGVAHVTWREGKKPASSGGRGPLTQATCGRPSTPQVRVAYGRREMVGRPDHLLCHSHKTLPLGIPKPLSTDDSIQITTYRENLS